jgi:predicted DNA binding CopG/RHH family protein
MTLTSIEESHQKRLPSDRVVRIRFTSKQLQRIATAAEARGMKMEDWMIETLVVASRVDSET